MRFLNATTCKKKRENLKKKRKRETRLALYMGRTEVRICKWSGRDHPSQPQKEAPFKIELVLQKRKSNRK